jgi:hypothetical protein
MIKFFRGPNGDQRSGRLLITIGMVDIATDNYMDGRIQNTKRKYD